MIIDEAKKLLIKHLNPQEAKDITRFVTGLNSQEQLLNYKKELNDNEENKVKDILFKRINGYPLQYILGKWTFMGRDFSLGEGVLIPRDDTEVVVLSVIPYLKQNNKARIIDLCSGSGIIAVTLKCMFPQCEVHALELSEKALPYLKRNIESLAPDVILHQGDLNLLFEQFKDNYFDLVISNPPYIESEIIPTLQTEVQKEPKMALDGGTDGLDFYRSITQKWSDKLKPGGMMAFELGEGQFDRVKAMMKEIGFENINEFKDLGNIQRAINGTLK
ncbi:MAG: peptide chain release factor N(5)-glutamine methyltransferase [Oscillospiraceae bacterium]|nr:peptide chain release factor N(5)-glutamine methyltransferase [Oscillospiraceae bacterium]